MCVSLCVCVCVRVLAAVIVLHLLAYSFHLYFISFHFISFYFPLYFVAFPAGCYELFYIHIPCTLNMRHMFLAVALNIYMHFLFILRHFHCVPQITFSLLQMLSCLQILYQNSNLAHIEYYCDFIYKVHCHLLMVRSSFHFHF